MADVRALLLASCFLMYAHQSVRVSARFPEDVPVRPRDNAGQEKELLGALQHVLEKLQNRRLGTWEKKLSRLPQCDIGDYCSVKKGARFGKLCDCPRGVKCNFFFLKCL
ncbi:cocaine- and amphetamine-regulated transcript protein-like [Lepisosteus oculatus]|uniref:cocaine- and amphetamine-regulated transcript protein-like n=1 Tax=Lepisosteus oculatus TaxID=7918 RepID=UPI00371AABF5